MKGRTKRAIEQARKKERVDFISTFVEIYWIETFGYSVSLFVELIYIFIAVLFSSFSFVSVFFLDCDSMTSSKAAAMVAVVVRRPNKSSFFFHCWERKQNELSLQLIGNTKRLGKNDNVTGKLLRLYFCFLFIFFQQ